jgi:hypothetical protein
LYWKEIILALYGKSEENINTSRQSVGIMAEGQMGDSHIPGTPIIRLGTPIHVFICHILFILGIFNGAVRMGLNFIQQNDTSNGDLKMTQKNFKPLFWKFTKEQRNRSQRISSTLKNNPPSRSVKLLIF